jgi:hypothetical protein
MANKITTKTNKSKRISHKENFELCYLRHQYVKKVKHKPTHEETKPYSWIVRNLCEKNYDVYKNLFLLIGLDMDDLLNASNVHLYSFLGLFALERNPKKLREFKKNFKNRNSIVCTPNDILDKNKANFTCFLKQRMEDMVRICRQKARNIKGIQSDQFVVFVGDKLPPKDIEDLLSGHLKHGFHPVGLHVFSSLKKKMDRQEGPVYSFNNKWYVCVPIRKKTLTLTDFTCNQASPYDNTHTMNPEEVLEKTQEDIIESVQITVNQGRFNALSNEEKKRVIKMFVSENKKNKEFEKEITYAKTLLEKLNVS